MSAATALGLPPGVRFEPTGEELVQFYLLPRALGRPPAVPGVVIEDPAVTTGAVHPWRLLERHGRTGDDEAYFFERPGPAAKPGDSRRDRGCGSRWTWVGQRRRARSRDGAVPVPGGSGGGRVAWSKYALNLHRGRGRSGSTGWVLHEYTLLDAPPCASPVKICHVAFTGHGQKRQRVPDDDDDGEGEPVPEPQAAPRKRVATDAAARDQEPVVIQSQATDQEELASHSGPSSMEAYCALLASDVGPSDQEPPPTEQHLWQQLAHLLQGVDSPRNRQAQPAHHEEETKQPQQLPEPGPGSLLPTTDQGSCTTTEEQLHEGTGGLDDFFHGWGDLDSFCDTTGVQADDEDVAA